MKRILIALMMGLALIVPASAEEVCHKREDIKAQMFEIGNDVSILYETDLSIRFTSPTRPQDIVLLFKKDCLAHALLVDKENPLES